MSLSVPTPDPPDGPPGAPLGDLHARMVEAVAVGDGLDALARLAAEAGR
jgi:hypothetical protein